MPRNHRLICAGDVIAAGAAGEAVLKGGKVLKAEKEEQAKEAEKVRGESTCGFKKGRPTHKTNGAAIATYFMLGTGPRSFGSAMSRPQHHAAANTGAAGAEFCRGSIQAFSMRRRRKRRRRRRETILRSGPTPGPAVWVPSLRL